MSVEAARIRNAFATAEAPVLRPAPELGVGAANPVHAGATYRLGYFLFLLTTASLFIRPAEIFKSMDGWPIFQVLVLSSLAMSYPVILEQLRWRNLSRSPGIVCILGMTVAIMLSRGVSGDFYGARSGAADFLKVVVYFLLLVGLLNTVRRLRGFLFFTSILILVTGVLATLNYHGLLHVHDMTAIQRGDGGINAVTGQEIVFRQLEASGIFSDPNDFALVLVLALLACMHFIVESRSTLNRLLLLVPAGALGYAFALTKSRGGLLSLLAGVTVWLISRFGWRRASLLLFVVMPAIFVVFAGRQTNINLDAHDTAQSRIRLWRDGIGFIKEAPLFGIGYNTYAQHTDNVAHNSYLHCYAELGFFGGTLFLGAFVFPIAGIASAATRRRLRILGEMTLVPSHEPDIAKKPTVELGPSLNHLRSCLLAVGVAYAVGLFSLSRAYAVSTYLMLGLLYATKVLVSERDPSAAPKISTRMCGVLVVVSACWLGFIWMFVKVLVRAGG